MIFSEKLKELRKERKITQEQLASIIGVERSSVGKYETGTQPSTDIIKRIADYFDVSVDYLLGEYIDSKGISIARKRVHALSEEKNPLFGDVEAAFGTSIATLKAWSNGYGDFFNDKLDKLADFFGVSIDYLLGREEKKSLSPAVTTEDEELMEYLEELKTRPEMRVLFSLSKNATKEDVEDAVRIIEALRKGRQG